MANVLSPSLLTPSLLALANEILEWVKANIAVPHDEVKRDTNDQTVCPFVAPSIDNDQFYLVFHTEVTGQSLEMARQIVLGYIHTFRDVGPWDERQQLTKALLVVFPNLSEQDSQMLDVIKQSVKFSFVEKGLMLAQFHPTCDQRGVYNQGWRSQVSPHCFIAIRHMAFHDILFLGDEAQWFHQYNVRFGNKYNEPEKLEDYEKRFVAMYQRAKTAFRES